HHSIYRSYTPRPAQPTRVTPPSIPPTQFSSRLTPRLSTSIVFGRRLKPTPTDRTESSCPESSNTAASTARRANSLRCKESRRSTTSSRSAKKLRLTSALTPKSSTPSPTRSEERRVGKDKRTQRRQRLGRAK